MLLVAKIVLFILFAGFVLTMCLAFIFMLWSPTWRAHFSPIGPSRRQAQEAFRRQVEQQRLAQQAAERSN